MGGTRDGFVPRVNSIRHDAAVQVNAVVVSHGNAIAPYSWERRRAGKRLVVLSEGAMMSR